MNYRLKITNMQDFDPSHEDYGVILAEKHPEVEFTTSKKNQVVDTYLWYPFKIDIQPHTFAAYYKEKLAITDSEKALFLVDLWNDEVHNGTLKTVSFTKVLTVHGINFGVIKIPKSTDAIVMRIGGVRFPYQKIIHAGRGGNAWQYLSRSQRPTHAELKAKFNLNKSQQERFIKVW